MSRSTSCQYATKTRFHGSTAIYTTKTTFPNRTTSTLDRDTGLYYKSQKVLGEMYRSVDIPSLLKDWNINSGWNEDGPMELWEEIEENLKTAHSSLPEYMAGVYCRSGRVVWSIHGRTRDDRILLLSITLETETSDRNGDFFAMYSNGYIQQMHSRSGTTGLFAWFASGIW